MELKKLSVHPLCLITGVLCALTGTLWIFLAAVLAALEHECAHAIAAKRYGYTLDRVVLMPYGAVVSGDLGGIPKREELWVLLAGPLCNLATGIFFVALWWMYPESYPFTELAAAVSFSLFFVNLLPAYPLDGGRVLYLLLSPLKERRARAICRAASLLIAAAALGYFVYSCFHKPAFTALAFAVLLAAGGFGGGRYARVPLPRRRDFSHGAEERRVAVDGSLTGNAVLRYFSEDRYLTLLLFDKGEFLGELGEEELLFALEKEGYDVPLKNFLSVL